MLTAFIAGLVLVTASIVGGGLKFGGNEVPLIKSTWQRFSLGVIGLVLLTGSGYMRLSGWQKSIDDGSSSQQTSKRSSSHDLSGIVVDAKTDRPVPNASVAVAQDSSPPEQRYTDSRGVFHLLVRDVAATVTVFVSADDYEAQSFDEPVSRTSPLLIRLNKLHKEFSQRKSGSAATGTSPLLPPRNPGILPSAGTVSNPIAQSPIAPVPIPFSPAADLSKGSLRSTSAANARNIESVRIMEREWQSFIYRMQVDFKNASLISWVSQAQRAKVDGRPEPARPVFMTVQRLQQFADEDSGISIQFEQLVSHIKAVRSVALSELPKPTIRQEDQDEAAFQNALSEGQQKILLQEFQAEKFHAGRFTSIIDYLNKLGERLKDAS